jgi:DnaK suppressor protein
MATKSATKTATKTAPKKTKSEKDVKSSIPTEAELMKMPESDYMNARQLAFFKQRLQQLEDEILANADETTEHLRETQFVPDPADRATIEEEHALELRTRDRERKLLKKVQQSLMRIESGDYGWCEETGEAIGIARLLARPTATLSLEAQERREMRQKMFGD